MSHLTRELCSNCRKFSGLGFHSSQWDQVVREDKRNDILCLPCFAMFADEKGIAWDDGLEIYPVSLATHRESVESVELEASYD